MRWGFGRYLTVAERRTRAARDTEKLAQGGRAAEPVRLVGRSIARTFWGRSWCANLEAYSDFASRLPRGRSYLRSGSVLDLAVRPGRVSARVSGSRLYEVELEVAKLPKARWEALCRDCAGTIDSLVGLLQGQLSAAVMERVCRQETGLFPSPAEIRLSCSCPDWASMCKHVAAVLYGIGARLDERPELLFELRQVDARDLVQGAGAELPLARAPLRPGRALEGVSLAELFGIDLADASARRERGRPVRKPAPEAGRSRAPGKGRRRGSPA